MEPAIFYRALLSPREHKCIKLLCNGRRQREIAKQMKVTIGTVGVYMSRIRDKLDARTNAQAAVKYLQLAVPALPVSDDADIGSVSLIQPAPQGDGLTQPGADVAAPDALSDGNGSGVETDQNPLHPASSDEGTASPSLLGG